MQAQASHRESVLALHILVLQKVLALKFQSFLLIQIQETAQKFFLQPQLLANEYYNQPSLEEAILKYDEEQAYRQHPFQQRQYL